MKFISHSLLAMCASIALQAQVPDFTPPTPLYAALMKNNTVEARKLLDAGADPNAGRLAALGFSPLHFAILHGNKEVFQALVGKAADVKVLDASGSTMLMWAAMNEAGSVALVDELLRMGVDVNAKNKLGETALDWAKRRGNTAVVARLRAAGADENERVRQAVEKSIALMQKSGPQFVRVSGCVSCHHQSLPQMAMGEARAHGVAVQEGLAKQAVDSSMAMYKSLEEPMRQGTDMLPDTPITVGYGLVGLGAEGFTRNSTTDAMVHVIATKQQADGRFPSLPARVPMESSDISATALSLRALQLYGEKVDDKIARAAAWLKRAQARTNEEAAMQILGLAWAQSNGPELRSFAKQLMSRQKADGGWSQLETLESDAYATGQALYALAKSGLLQPGDAAFQRGIDYLVRTQEADGSWHVRSRAFPVQPLKESGYPHGRDQWISISGASWATMALAVSLPTPNAANSAGH